MFAWFKKQVEVEPTLCSHCNKEIFGTTVQYYDKDGIHSVHSACKGLYLQNYYDARRTEKAEQAMDRLDGVYPLGELRHKC